MFCSVNSERNTMDKEEVLKRVREEEDYIRCPKCSNSLAKFLAKNSEKVDKGLDDAAIAHMLMIPEEKVQEIYEDAVKKLRAEMVDEDEN